MAIEALTGEDVAAAYVVRLPKAQGEGLQYQCRQAFTPVAHEMHIAARRLWISLDTKEGGVAKLNELLERHPLSALRGDMSPDEYEALVTQFEANPPRTKAQVACYVVAAYEWCALGSNQYVRRASHRKPWGHNPKTAKELAIIAG